MSMSTQFIRNSIVSILFAVVILVITLYSESVHIPFLINMILSFLIGILEPKKGWILAIIQGVIVMAGYVLVMQFKVIHAVRPDLALFTTYFALPIAFTGSYLGGFLKRAIS